MNIGASNAPHCSELMNPKPDEQSLSTPRLYFSRPGANGSGTSSDIYPRAAGN
jgi:hypothetical protein